MKRTLYKSLIRDLRLVSDTYSCKSEIEKLVTALDWSSKSFSVKSACAAQRKISAVQKKIKDADLKNRLEQVRRSLQSQKDKLKHEFEKEDYSYASTIGGLDFCSEYDC